MFTRSRIEKLETVAKVRKVKKNKVKIVIEKLFAKSPLMSEHPKILETMKMSNKTRELVLFAMNHHQEVRFTSTQLNHHERFGKV